MSTRKPRRAPKVIAASKNSPAPIIASDVISGVLKLSGTFAPVVAPEPSRSVLDHAVKLSFVGSNVSYTSLAIEVFSAGPVCHVDAIEPITGLLWGARFDLVGGKPRGFYGRPASYIAAETARVVVAIPCTREQLEGFWRAAHQSEGEKYDWLGIVGFGTGENWHSKGKAFCSEKQRELLAGQKILPAKFFAKAWKTTPMGLLESLTARNDTVIVLRKGC